MVGDGLAHRKTIVIEPRDLRFSVAPMMDWTDRHCRFFHRLMSRRARLYTEMVTTGAVIHGDRERLLGFDAAEHPVALQLGGSEPEALAQAARIGEDFGYAEINLNCGCPSDRVQNGSFGACLMREPQRVADGVAAIKAVVKIPVTVKCRIGVDDQDPEEALDALVALCVQARVDAIIVHARKAWLQGLSPRENRDIPPLDYARVFRLKKKYPSLPVAINGGITTMAQAADLLAPHTDAAHDGVMLDGVMIGRAAYQDPGILLRVDPQLFGEDAPLPSERAVVEAMIPYMAAHLRRGGRLSHITRHMLGLFAGQPGARAFRRTLATRSVIDGAGVEVVRDALACVRERPHMEAAE
ncbi:MAG: tRNA dihydrouridine(20/20a) synthase DusA [Beijerinckiaceae bacterium]